ncbi:acyl transferase 15-like [Lolium rigidum]|uniref:acyl transferase 15-like n=1 Tax=Lolium rigidum TaxID=89674 RepID=UPI001F5CA934|nr:acyl transferase 15-like [Lolium rigidum]
MRFAVSKSPPVIVRPSSTELAPAPGKAKLSQVQLSSWDRSYVGFQVTALLLFDSPVNQPVEAVKKGLSRALVHYAPIAGRLAAEDEQSLSIACTGEGVPFVAATADCAMADHAGLLDGAPFSAGLLDDLAMYYQPAARRTDPLLLMQVTEFACGGFAVGVTWNHTLADGDGMAQFLQDVGNLARADEAAVSAPLRDGGAVSLPLLSPPVVAAKQWLMLNRGGMGLAYLDITIPATLINRIKSEYKAAHAADGGYCTTFEAGVAVLWRCRTRAIIGDNYDPTATAPLAFFVNVRKHVRAVAGYYGNCAVAQVAFATAGEVVGGDIAGVIDLIKGAKDGVPDLLNAMHGGRGVEGVGEMGEEEMAAVFGYNALMVTSWRNIAFDRVDFGGGVPARVVGRWQQSTIPGCMAFLSCRATADAGERMLTQCVREEHAAAFLDELHRLAAADGRVGLVSVGMNYVTSK